MEHLDQIQRAIDFIENNLGNDISVDDIAREAAFSRWHFQIVFSSAIGETVKEYIRKRRLSNSLNLLKLTDQRLIDISLEAGFESQEAYTRAFKNQFGITPGEYRKNGTHPKTWRSATMIDFIEFPKIARLNREIVVTEKIDGTNGAIHIEHLVGEASLEDEVGAVVPHPEEGVFVVTAQSRNRIVTPNKDKSSTDNHGFAGWVHANAAVLAEVLGTGTHYGEWLGGPSKDSHRRHC
jgi:AraC-like DNA-binding protein